eukprot:7019329-Prorocentrum_lima.AAC.1
MKEAGQEVFCLHITAGAEVDIRPLLGSSKGASLRHLAHEQDITELMLQLTSGPLAWLLKQLLLWSGQLLETYVSQVPAIQEE